MLERISTARAYERMQAIVGKPLKFGHMLPTIGMFDFGFGDLIDIPTNSIGKTRKVCMYALHAVCGFDVVWKNGQRRVERLYWDSPKELFDDIVKELIGLCVKRITLSDKNDLWIDLRDYWVVFLTFENDEESWRFFTPYSSEAHLVVSNSWISLDF